MKDKYAKFNKLKSKIEKAETSLKLLKSELSDVQEEIVEELKNVSKPLKCQYGTFSTYKLKKYRFSDSCKEVESTIKKMIQKYQDDIKEVQKSDIEPGKVKLEEKIYLRYKSNE